MENKKTECPTCNGSGEAVFSCCTGEVIHDDLMMCPKCYEHLGEEECPDCEGTGEIEENQETTPITFGLQHQAEFIRDSLKDMNT